MRDNDSLAKQVREIQLELQELKQTQFTGKDQVVVQEFTTEPISVATSYQSPMVYNRRCYVRIRAENLPEGSVLLAHVVPIVKYNGSVVQNNTSSSNISTQYLVNPFRDADLRNADFYLFLSNTSVDGSDISSRTYSVSFKVYVSANVTTEVGVR